LPSQLPNITQQDRISFSRMDKANLRHRAIATYRTLPRQPPGGLNRKVEATLDDESTQWRPTHSVAAKKSVIAMTDACLQRVG